MSKFTFIYDTYCGWCYGAAPVIDALIGNDAEFECLHRYLFQGQNARVMADGFGERARQFDRQISQLSGQRFSQSYFDNILDSKTEILESGLTARAAALVHDRGARVEMALARALQKARYEDGISASEPVPVVDALRSVGFDFQPREILDRLNADETGERVRELQGLAMQWQAKVGASGVPTLIRSTGNSHEFIDCTRYFSAPHSIAAVVRAA